MTTTTAANILTENTLSLHDAAKRIPSFRSGSPTHVSCLMRWVKKGVKMPTGTVYLEAIRIGGRWITSLEALARFGTALSAVPGNPPPRIRTPAARRRAQTRAEAVLDRAEF